MLQLDIPNFRTTPVKKNVIEWQLTLLKSIAKSYIYREYLYELIERTFEDTPRKAMIHTHNSMFNDFIAKWPMIFGHNARNNRTHWEKALVKDHNYNFGPNAITPEGYRNAILGYLQASVGIDHQTYNKARTAVRTARDRYSAHLDINNVPPMPDLRYPYEISKAYSELLTHIQEEDDFWPPQSISDREEFYEEEAQIIFVGY